MKITYVLPKAYRLTKKKDFDAAFKNGRTIKEGPLLLKVAANRLGSSRFGFVVSKKISSKATVRNTVKRRLREVFSHELGSLKKAFDVVVVALPGIEKKEFSELQRLAHIFFKKIT